ncbi:MAG: hypothetical protein ABIK83_12970 [Candidatus Zixiibacteriota bacterium]
MKKATTGTVLVFFLTLAFSVILIAADADEIFNKHIEAMGGMKKLEALESLKMSGKINMGGMTGDIVITKKAPNFHLLQITSPMFEVNEGCDGKNVWSTSPMGFKTYDGVELEKRLEQTRIEPLVGFKERGGKYEFVAEEPVKGVDCYKMLYMQSTGDTTYTYYDKDTYYMVKTEVDTPEGPVEQFFEDFKTIDGYVYPFKLRTVSAQGRMMVTFDSIAVNQKVDESLFVMPDSASVPTRMKPVPDSLKDQPLKRPGN